MENKIHTPTGVINTVIMKKRNFENPSFLEIEGFSKFPADTGGCDWWLEKQRFPMVYSGKCAGMAINCLI